MRSLRSLALFLALTAYLSLPAVVSAGAPPIPPGGDTRLNIGIVPLSPEQVASIALKTQQEQAIAGLTGASRLSAGCPTGVGMRGAAGPKLVCPGTPPYSLVLATSPRQQLKSYYCGPATVQVVSNFSWGLSGTNRWSQGGISDSYTHTDAHGETWLPDMINGMNGTSRLPSGFVFAQKHNPTFSDWHNTIITDVFNWQMALAAGVKPFISMSKHLHSWPNSVFAKHYIALNGYSAYAWMANPLAYYDDSSGGYGGTTGAFSDPSPLVFDTMNANSGNMIW